MERRIQEDRAPGGGWDGKMLRQDTDLGDTDRICRQDIDMILTGDRCDTDRIPTGY